MTVEFAHDLSNSLHWGEPTVLRLWWITNLFQLKIHRAEIRHVLCVQNTTVTSSSVLCG